MPARKTNEQFLKEIFELVGDEYTFLDEYTVVTAKLNVKHKSCERTYLVEPRKFLEGRRCSECRNRENGERKRVPYAVFMERLSDVFGDEYSVLGKYVAISKKVRVRHNTCKREYDAVPSTLLMGIGCQPCGMKRGGFVKRKSQSEFESQLAEKFSGEYKLMSKYERTDRKVLMKHNIEKCGYEYDVTPNQILHGHGCPKCSGSLGKSNEQFLEDLKSVHGGDYSPLDEYVADKSKMDVRHNKCGNIWGVTPNNLLSGHGCPMCKSSMGEKRIFKVLSELGVNFKTQFRMSGCKNNRELPFDFAVFDFDGELSFLIEFDGMQHFNKVGYWGGDTKLKLTQKHDEIKNEYCSENGLNLIRIPYWDFDEIDAILYDALVEEGIIIDMGDVI